MLSATKGVQVVTVRIVQIAIVSSLLIYSAGSSPAYGSTDASDAPIMLSIHPEQIQQQQTNPQQTNPQQTKQAFPLRHPRWNKVLVVSDKLLMLAAYAAEICLYVRR